MIKKQYIRKYLNDELCYACDGWTFVYRDERRKNLTEYRISKLKTYITRRIVKRGNEPIVLLRLQELLYDYFDSEGEDREDAMYNLAFFLHGHSEFYNKFLASLSKKRRRNRIKAREKREQDLEDEMSRNVRKFD